MSEQTSSTADSTFDSSVPFSTSASIDVGASSTAFVVHGASASSTSASAASASASADTKEELPPLVPDVEKPSAKLTVLGGWDEDGKFLEEKESTVLVDEDVVDVLRKYKWQRICCGRVL